MKIILEFEDWERDNVVAWLNNGGKPVSSEKLTLEQAVERTTGISPEMLGGNVTPVMPTPPAATLPAEVLETAQGVPTPPAAPAVERPADALDAEGLPWDERIHSSNHKMTAKGVWTRRRGITDELYSTVKAELLSGVTPPVAGTLAPGAPAAVLTPPAAPAVEQPATVPTFLQTGGMTYATIETFVNDKIGYDPLGAIGKINAALNPLGIQDLSQLKEADATLLQNAYTALKGVFPDDAATA